MIIVCTGGRDYKDVDKVHHILNMLSPMGIIVGDCPTGVDLFIREWCESVKIIRPNFKYTVLEANWDKEGLAAGPIRNKKMVMLGKKFTNVLLLAFKGGKGTADCIKHARAVNMIVLEAK